MNGPAMKPMRKRRRRVLHKNKCVSCRRLKIKCDEATPKCEYCEHTNRECVYPTEKELEEFALVAAVKTAALTSTRSGTRLNSTTSQMQISKFELRLLHYFNQIYLNDQSVENPGMERIWKFEVPILWQQSDLVRHSVFSLTAMILWNICDLEAMYKEDYDPNEIQGRSDFSSRNRSTRSDSQTESIHSASTSSELSIECEVSSKFPLTPGQIDEFKQTTREEFGIDADNVEQMKNLLFTKSNEYFIKCLNRTYKVMETIQRQDMSVKSQYQAAEIVMSGILLFSFLALQPHGLVPLMTFDPKVTDLVSMVKGMKVSMGKSFPLLFNSGYSGLFHASEHLFPPTFTEDDSYPICENLKSNLEEYLEAKSIVAEEERGHFREALRLLDIVFYRTIEMKNPSPILRYIFLFDHWILDDAKQNKNVFSLKILFTYAALCLMSKLRLFSEANIYLDYLHWYKELNMELFGDWRYPDDEAFYDLIAIKGLVIDNKNFDVLKTFDPLIYSIEN
ncbi:hypothetical protein CLIB1423_16S01948 [[Candida] railenensis]|uniref:Zn(2)-C6 fungal-type domain-containing protein n=1 Tax=[Candida] railenensis TaxID=45579 RepID=A0A9P0W0A0_9ASCO|nr:hypothetical protein CLIB1423_16S01948 [[Candida] railenensis]